MYTVGEVVNYGVMGVMRITDVTEETLQDVTKKYYVLEELRGDGSSKIFVPLDNERLVASIRPLISKIEAQELLEEIKDLAEVDWHRDNRVRTERFREIIESCDRRMILSMIKTVISKAHEREAEGKKGFISDTNMMNKAKKMLYSELAYVLELPYSEAAEHFDAFFG